MADAPRGAERSLALRAVGRLLGIGEGAAVPVLHWLRRQRLLLGVRAQCVLRRSTVRLSLAAGVRLGGALRVTVGPGTTNEVSLGPGSRLGDGARLVLNGGRLVVGPDVEIRHHCVIELAGTLVVDGPALLCHGTTIHCDDRVAIGSRSVVGEYATIADSAHFHGEDGGWFLDNVRSAPVVLGRDVWLAAKATVTSGVRLGDGAVVGANSTVVHDVPGGAFVSGVPAVLVRAGGPSAPADQLAARRAAAWREARTDS